MTIIKAINDLSNKMLMKSDFSKIKDCEALSTVTEYFNVSKEEAIIASTFICRRIEEDLSAYFCLEDLERDWTCTLTEILGLLPYIDSLLEKKVFLLRNRQPYIKGSANRSTSFLIDDNLLDILCYNKPFSEYTPEYDENFKYDVPTLFLEIGNLTKRVLLSRYLFSDFIKPYRNNEWINELLVKIDETPKEQKVPCLKPNLKFFLLAIKHLQDDKTMSVADLCRYCNFSPSDTVEMIKSFKEEKNKLLIENYLEIDKTDIADNVQVKYGSKVLESFEGFEDILLVDKPSKELNKIMASDIKEKELFYNKENQNDVDRLSRIIEEEQYQKLRSRLEEKNLPKGLTVLLYGSPGTGKTETVMQLARKAGRDVFHLNIEQVKSCWVGESEKNVKGIFKAYYASKSKIKPILLFNEADAIISKRTSVDSSNSAVTKMENAIQNLLLEELEKFDGIFIATTNRETDIDQAFDRRLLFKLKFENPSLEVKEKIWKSKLDFISDDDARKLSSSFDLSGGQIDNIFRKSEIDYILYGKKPNIDDLMEFCRKEKLSNENRNPLGFRN